MESLLIVVVLFVILGFGLALVRTRAGANRQRIDKGKTSAIDGNSATEVEERPSDQHSSTAVTDSLAPEAP
ncbi:MAG: hypothetical protein M1447_07345, partial [Gammaproteobacteria bacterium]|nr:hypothetical protein [Gammaproteobacteria bacterium]